MNRRRPPTQPRHHHLACGLDVDDLSHGPDPDAAVRRFGNDRWARGVGRRTVARALCALVLGRRAVRPLRLPSVRIPLAAAAVRDLRRLAANRRRLPGARLAAAASASAGAGVCGAVGVCTGVGGEAGVEAEHDVAHAEAEVGVRDEVEGAAGLRLQRRGAGGLLVVRRQPPRQRHPRPLVRRQHHADPPAVRLVRVLLAH
mmetsp:Transcript_49810/g.118080  ORF Transcript_49810/g.118080 Transcript_49810/m.118080 type:complete len:201 (+) Transcript_49810:457-1059(+)